MDYEHMTAPCGLPCFECYLYLANDNEDIRMMVSKELGISPEKASCKGCRNENGRCAHLPTTCRLYPCAEQRGIKHCCDCSDFPCDYLHPYADNAKLWHNTKVFNLSLIKKMGLKKWAKEKAKNVLQTYSFEKWTL
jgi:hypothetical protein